MLALSLSLSHILFHTHKHFYAIFRFISLLKTTHISLVVFRLNHMAHNKIDHNIQSIPYDWHHSIVSFLIFLIGIIFTFMFNEHHFTIINFHGVHKIIAISPSNVSRFAIFGQLFFEIIFFPFEVSAWITFCSTWMWN